MKRSQGLGVSVFAAGLLFGLGLAVAQMTDPLKVLAFLDLAGDWDPSLLCVLGAAVAVAFVGWRWPRPAAQPRWEGGFHPPAPARIDRPLLLGSALFGLGWGLAGYCPGPAIASLGFGNAEALWFLPAMLAGAWLADRWTARRNPNPPPEER